MELLNKNRSKIIFSFIFGLIVVTALAILGDFRKMLEVLTSFNWFLLVPILLLTLTNYVLRFLKWHYYLKVVGHGAEKTPAFDSGVIFISGLSMAMTPGKVGELLKPFLVRQVTGTPVTVTAPIIVAERVSDGIAMLILASTGVAFFQQPILRLTLLVILLAALALLVIIQWRSVALWLIHLGGRVPFFSSRLQHLLNLYESSYRLFSPKSSLVGVGLGILGWACECSAFFLVMLGLGFNASLEMLIKCTFILASSTLIGSVSLLPGGLGAADGSIDGLLHVAFSNISAATSSAATLLIRFSTLWFGVTLGLATLLIFHRRFEQAAPLIEVAPEATVPSAQPIFSSIKTKQ